MGVTLPEPIDPVKEKLDTIDGKLEYVITKVHQIEHKQDPVTKFHSVISLDVTDKELTPQEKQNRYGLKHLPAINDLGQGRFLTLLAIELNHEMTPPEYFKLLTDIKESDSMIDQDPAVQMLAANAIPVFPGKSVDLYTTAHMRIEDVPDPSPEPLPELLPEEEEEE